MKGVGLPVSATQEPAGARAGYTDSLHKCPCDHIHFLSASELQIRTMNFELCFIFSPAERTGLLQQLKNSHRTTRATLCRLVCLFIVSILWKSLLVLKIGVCVYVCARVNNKPLKLAETD